MAYCMRKSIFIVFLILPVFIFGQNKEQDIIELMEGYVKKADSLYKTQDYGLALPIYLQVDSISKEKKIINHMSISSTLSRAEISKSTFTKESSQMAYRLGKEALEDAKEINSEESINLCYVKLADYAQLTRRIDESKQYVDAGLKYYITLNNGHEEKISRLYLMESACYNAKGEIDKCAESRLKAIQYLEDKNNDYEMAKATYYYGHYLRYKKEDYKNALPYLEESKTLHDKVNKKDNDLYHRCLRDLAMCYDVFDDHEKSKYYYKQAYNLNIELNKRANRNTSRRLETKYQSEKKEQEIQLLTSQKKLAEQEKKSQRNILLGGLGILGLAGIFLYLLYRNRKETSEKLRDLDRAKSKFFANISHEFRTPLTLITNPIESAIEDEELSHKKREQFKMAKRNSDRLLSLVNQLLDLSKIDAGKLRLQIQEGPITKHIAALADSFSFSTNKKDLNFLVNIEHSEVQTYFDKDAVEKIIVNLLSNAIKYTPKGGTIHCDALVNNGMFNLEIRNTGLGLTNEELKNIFQRFYQTSEDNIGTGIGLALVKELVDLHKGTIKVDSKPNMWTTFKITLPIDKASFKNDVFIASEKVNTNVVLPTELAEETSEELSNNSLPILLIVEDNADVRILLKQTFEDHYSILTAENGHIGTTLAIDHIPDIIISDIMMPIKDGIQLTQELKNDQRTSHIPIILLTAKAGEENELTGVQTGADDYITKPFSSKILIAKVSKLIEVRRKLRERYSQELILIPKEIVTNNLDAQFLEKLQSILEEKLVESSFSIEDFSKALGLSRMQLHRKLKAITGLSASDFIRSQRLKLAAQLIKKSDINVAQVGYHVGFNDHSYFSKRFKEAYKCTPTEYAKKYS